MRLSKCAALGAAILLIGCSDGGDDAKLAADDSTAVDSPTDGDVCAAATTEVVSGWFGWDVERIASDGDSCTFDGLPFGQLTIASTAAGVTVTAVDGYSDEPFAEYLTAALGASNEDTDSRVAALDDLDAEGYDARCGLLLSVGADDLSIWTQPSSAEFQGGNWPTNGLARLEFGSGLNEDVCASPIGTTTRTVDASWPVTFDRFEFTITPSNGACGEATLVLHGAVALAPDGRPIALPDPLTTRNHDFGVFPPDDCQLR